MAGEAWKTEVRGPHGRWISDFGVGKLEDFAKGDHVEWREQKGLSGEYKTRTGHVIEGGVRGTVNIKPDEPGSWEVMIRPTELKHHAGEHITEFGKGKLGDFRPGDHVEWEESRNLMDASVPKTLNSGRVTDAGDDKKRPGSYGLVTIRLDDMPEATIREDPASLRHRTSETGARDEVEQRFQQFVTKARDLAVSLTGASGSRYAGNHEVPVQGNEAIAAYTAWDGKIAIRMDYAKQMRDALDPSIKGDPDGSLLNALSVMLHEQIHDTIGVTPEPGGAEPGLAARLVYGTPAGAEMEEGFTELATRRNLEKFVKGLGLDKQTNFFRRSGKGPEHDDWLARAHSNATDKWIMDGNIHHYGTYYQKTAEAEAWVKAVAKLEQKQLGTTLSGKSLNDRMTELANEVAREGTSTKPQAMLMQAFRAVGLEDRETKAGKLSDLFRGKIFDDFPNGPRDWSDLFKLLQERKEWQVQGMPGGGAPKGQDPFTYHYPGSTYVTTTMAEKTPSASIMAWVWQDPFKRASEGLQHLNALAKNASGQALLDIRGDAEICAKLAAAPATKMSEAWKTEARGPHGEWMAGAREAFRKLHRELTGAEPDEVAIQAGLAMLHDYLKNRGHTTPWVDKRGKLPYSEPLEFAWNPAAHPRIPKGLPGGGEFLHIGAKAHTTKAALIRARRSVGHAVKAEVQETVSPYKAIAHQTAAAYRQGAHPKEDREKWDRHEFMVHARAVKHTVGTGANTFHLRKVRDVKRTAAHLRWTSRETGRKLSIANDHLASHRWLEARQQFNEVKDQVDEALDHYNMAGAPFRPTFNDLTMDPSGQAEDWESMWEAVSAPLHALSQVLGYIVHQVQALLMHPQSIPNPTAVDHIHTLVTQATAHASEVQQIAEQILHTAGFSEAWETELRGPGGKWVKSLVGEARHWATDFGMSHDAKDFKTGDEVEVRGPDGTMLPAEVVGANLPARPPNSVGVKGDWGTGTVHPEDLRHIIPLEYRKVTEYGTGMEGNFRTGDRVEFKYPDTVSGMGGEKGTGTIARIEEFAGRKSFVVERDDGQGEERVFPKWMIHSDTKTPPPTRVAGSRSVDELSHIDPVDQQQVVSRIDKMVTLHPQAAKSIHLSSGQQAFDILDQGDTPQGKAETGAVTVSGWIPPPPKPATVIGSFASSIAMNPAYLAHDATLRAASAPAWKNRFHPNKDPLATVDHEWAHALTNYVFGGDNNLARMKLINRAFGIDPNLPMTAQRMLIPDEKELRKVIGKYGSTSLGEFIAECYAWAHETDPTQRANWVNKDVAQKVADLLDQAVSEKESKEARRAPAMSLVSMQ